VASVPAYRPEAYLARPVDADAEAILARDGALLVVGRPLSGKTRLLCELLRKRPDVLVVWPNAAPPNMLPTQLRRPVLLIFDDLHTTIEHARPLDWYAALGPQTVFIATVRDGHEWDTLATSGERLLAALKLADRCVYTSAVGPHGADLTRDKVEPLRTALKLTDDDLRRFDGTPGSLFVDLAKMRARYDHFVDDREEYTGDTSPATLLQAAKLLHVARQPQLRGPLLYATAKDIIASSVLSRTAWERHQRRVTAEGFGRFDDPGTFTIYHAYLDHCVTWTPETEDLARLLPLFDPAQPGDAIGLLYLGVVLQERQHPAATRCWELAGAENLSEAWYLLAESLDTQPARRDDAERYYRRAAECGVIRAWYELGNRLVSQRDRWGEAEATYRRAVAEDPHDADSWHSIGFVLIAQPARWGEAEAAYRRAAAEDPHDVQAWYGLGFLLSRQPARWEEAEAAYRRAAAERSSLVPIWANLGHLLSRQPAREAEAEGAYRRAIAEHQRDAYSWRYLGGLLSRQPAHEAEAVEAYRRAAAVGPRLSSSWNALGVLLAKQVAREAEAEGAYRRAIAEHQHDASAWTNLGELLTGQPARWDEAEEALRRATTEDPHKASSWRSLGYLLTKQPARWAEAVEAYRRATAEDPHDASAWLSLGILQAQRPGHEFAAEQTFRQGVTAGATACWLSLGRLLSSFTT